ncbi:restriction endonuclease [Rhizobium sp. RU20A]|uniref:restriction endonuclease n=1 Tax=Rhizobium sp. RU20A TaxID=1907412 RepID=UPI001AEE4812|nr:restriction endonuclease [Rhizobium sp. RU20A]
MSDARKKALPMAGGRWRDEELEGEIQRVRGAIQAWAEQHDLWFDCGFTDYLKHVDSEPGDPPVVTLLIVGGDLHNMFEGYYGGELENGFSRLLEDMGYWYENRDGATVAIYPEEGGALSARFQSYFHWQWVCSLIEEDTSDVYEELYAHFANRPEDLHRLHWRDFEVLLFRIFQNQGFKAELGPGSGDDGVDLRLWQRDPIGDVLTVVQAKRYAQGNKVNLTEVAALQGVADAERADRALFVTTSSYLPVARRFTARIERPLFLAERNDIVAWCAQAANGVVLDKSTLVSKGAVEKLIYEVAQKRDPRIVRARSGYNTTMNEFALVVKETKHAALLMGLSGATVSHDGFGQRGTEVPLLDGSTIGRLTGELVWRARRNVRDREVTYWDGRHLFYPWNGEPMLFDYVD